MDDGGTANVTYLDFVKVFEKVDQKYLLTKPESFGLCEKSGPVDQALRDGKNPQSVNGRCVVASGSGVGYLRDQ